MILITGSNDQCDRIHSGRENDFLQRYLIFGAIDGGISLRLLPALFIESGWLRIANLLVTPLLAGLLMEAIGAWRKQREKNVIRLETIAYGFCFAFSIALVRYSRSIACASSDTSASSSC